VAIGDVRRPEGHDYNDPETNAHIWQVTDWHAHSHHPCFTNSGLWDGGRRLLVASHRNNARNLYSLELASGELTQLTDFSPTDRPRLPGTFVNPVRDEAYFVNGRQLLALDLRTGRQRSLFSAEQLAGPRMNLGSHSCTADGKTIRAVLNEDLSEKLRLDLGHGHVGFPEYSAARPLSRVVAIDTDAGGGRVIHEERFWLGHMNTSPTLPEVATVCHEGPWAKIDQRMWRLDVATGEVSPLRQQVAGRRIGPRGRASRRPWFVRTGSPEANKRECIPPGPGPDDPSGGGERPAAGPAQTAPSWSARARPTCPRRTRRRR